MVHKRLGAYLLEMDALTEDQLQAALTLQQRSGARLGSILCEQGMVRAATVELACALQKREQGARHGIGAAVGMTLALVRRAAPDRMRLGLSIAGGAVAGLLSFPIIFYFYSRWAWDTIGLTTDLGQAIRISAATAVLIVLALALETFASFLCVSVTAGLLEELARQLHANIMQRQLMRNDERSGLLVSSIYAQHLEQFSTQLEAFLVTFPKTVAGLLGFFLIVFLSNTGIALLTIVLASVAVILPPMLASRAAPFQRKEALLMGAAMSKVEALFVFFRTTTGVLFERSVRLAAQAMAPHHLNQANKWFYWTTAFNLRSLLNFLTLSTLLIYGGFAVFSGSMALIDLFGIYVAVTLTLPRFNSLYDTYFQLSSAGYHAAIIEEQLRIACAQPSAAAPGLPRRVLVRIDRFGYGATPVLTRINLTLVPGRLYLVSGPSGCGKSTLAQLIAGLLPCTDGAIEAEDVDGARYALGLGSTAYIGQEHQFLERIPLEDALTYGNPGSAALAVASAARLGLDLTGRLGDPALSINAMFSGGEKQRLHLVQGLQASQKIKIFDEPTASLDAAAAALVQRELERVPEDEIRMVITHDSAWAGAAAYPIRLEAA